METGRICRFEIIWLTSLCPLYYDVRSEVFRGSRLEFCSALNPVDVIHLIPPVKLAHGRMLGGSLSRYDNGRNPTNVGAGTA